MARHDEMDQVFRELEESIRQAGQEDMAVPDIVRLAQSDLNETTRLGIREYIKQYRSWIELAKVLMNGTFGSEEEMLARLAALRGILQLATYYSGRLAAAVEHDRDVPWETRIAMDLMLTAFGEQLGA